MKIYDEIDIVGQVRSVGPHMQAELRRRFAGHELVGEVRGIGMIAALQFVADKSTRQMFDAATKLGPRLVKLCEHGVIARGLPNDSLAFSPPLIMTTDEVDEMLAKVGTALDELTVQLRRESIAAVA